MQNPRDALSGLFNVAGGLPYHALARRYHSMLWSDYARQVEQALVQWAPPGDELVVVGPSGGWLLPNRLLKRYVHVTAIEPDPMARWLLRRRFPQVVWSFDVHDYFTPYGDRPWREGLHHLAQQYPSQPIYFAEFLGQFIGLYPDAVAREEAGVVVATSAYSAWKEEFQQVFRHRPVFSSHDRLVAREAPHTAVVDLSDELPAADLALRLWQPAVAAADPLSGQLFPGRPRQVAIWQRQPGYWHAMELVSNWPEPKPDSGTARLGTNTGVDVAGRPA